MFDSHVHYDYPPFYRRAELVWRLASERGVKEAVHPAIDLDSSERALGLASFLPGLLPAIGIHPLYLKRYEVFPDASLEMLASRGGFKAVGEIGLDYWYGREESGKQMEFFLRQLDLAKRLKVPVLLHIRKAFYETMEAVKRAGFTGTLVFHAFSGSYEMAVHALDRGGYLSVCANITRPEKERLRAVLKKVPRNRLLVETDAPDMPPKGRRGGLHFPWDLPVTVAALGAVLGLSARDAGELTAENAKRVFHGE